MSIREEYKERYDNHLVSLARVLEEHIRENLKDVPRIDRVSARAKGVDSFVSKAGKEVNGVKKYSDPYNQIQDQIGVRVVTFYLDDVDAVTKEIEGYYRKIESKSIVPDSDSEFGYFGKHFILLIPDDLINDGSDVNKIPKFFELQVKTLFQHAWGEAEHDLGYKPGAVLSSDVKRRIAFTAAQAWGADQIFNELHKAAND
jgi:ppGpp synthetase/RelA/SpoT-type nucleotidyltranferase